MCLSRERVTDCVKHFDEKLLKLKDMMKTEEGILLANPRHEFMKELM